MAHTRKLRRHGVGVKRLYAALALDTEMGGRSEKGMEKTKRVQSDAELEWQAKVGRRIAWVREIAGFTQEQMAELLGIGQQAVSSYERGIRQQDPWIMLQFCARFQTTLDFVYRGKLEGVHPVLARLLVAAHPELARQPTDTEPGMDTDRAAYRGAIRES